MTRTQSEPAGRALIRSKAMNTARLLTALALAILAFAAVMIAQRDQGIARDEVVYMMHGKKYAAWWSDLLSGKNAVSEAAITRHFGGPSPTANNREHPPLMKTLMGISERLFHRGLGWTGELGAYRIPSAAMNALLVALVFLFTSAIWGYAAGLVAGLLTLFLPRAFFHAGLGAFDAAMVTLWMATLMAYYRALAGRRRAILVGVVFGLALATKHNALMLPAVILAHYVWVSGRAEDVLHRPGIKARFLALARGLWRTQPWIFVALMVLGPLVWIALWPWLWFDTAAHIADWIRFHLLHVHYNFEYLGKNWNAPPYPWHVPIVTTLFTVPVVTLVAALMGVIALVVRALRRQSREAGRAPGLLLLLSALVAMGPFVLGQTPIFGAEKHWAPAIPSLCIAAGVGVVAAVELCRTCLVRAGVVLQNQARYLGPIAMALVGTLVVAAAAVETMAAHPYALTHYNALAGGAPGGADLGMNRQFWGYAARGVLPYLDERAPAQGQPDRPVYTHDASPAWAMYRSLGLISARLPDAGHEQAGIQRSQMALVIHERHFNRHDYLIWSAYGTVQPAYVLTFQGVPIVSVYERPAPAAR